MSGQTTRTSRSVSTASTTGTLMKNPPRKNHRLRSHPRRSGTASRAAQWNSMVRMGLSFSINPFSMRTPLATIRQICGWRPRSGSGTRPTFRGITMSTTWRLIRLVLGTTLLGTNNVLRLSSSTTLLMELQDRQTTRQPLTQSGMPGHWQSSLRTQQQQVNTSHTRSLSYRCGATGRSCRSGTSSRMERSGMR